MTCLLYLIFTTALYLWTTSSIVYESRGIRSKYIVVLVVLYLFLFVIRKLDRQKRIFKGIVICALFVNLGISLAYRIGETQFHSYISDLKWMLFAGIFMYLFIRYTRLYRWKIMNLFIILCLPLFIFGARFTSHPVNGSYLTFMGMMIFGLVLTGFPFVVGTFTAMNEDTFVKSVTFLSVNLLAFLLYTLFLYLGCVMCNEFGLLLVVALTSTVIFFVRCKNAFTKILYSVTCMGGALLAAWQSKHISDRVKIWLNPSEAFGNAHLSQKAESVLYVFRHMPNIGWYGRGLGDLKKAYFPTLGSDHALFTLMNDYSLIIAILITLLGMMLVRWLLIEPEALCTYDRFMNFSIALIVGFILLIDVASNLGSFITAGIGFPWISDGAAVNIMLSCLVAVHAGLIGRRAIE